ncbi:MAG TPA: hypothetical protein VGY51_06380, partial [Acidimicrobiales bacterium]|nr:hypothetical protein [Acidimicrobiales bacterium]
MDRERGSLCPCGSRPRAGVPFGDGPAPIIGVGRRGARPRSVSRAGGHRARLTGGVGLAVLAGLLLTPGAAAAGPASPAAGREVAASASAGGGLPLTLVSQTPWVTPTQNLFDLQLRPGTSTPPAQLGVSVSVYGCLSSVSGFDQSVSASGPQGAPISSTRAPLALSGLPTVGPGVFDLSMPVVPGGTPGPAAAGGFTIALSSSGGQCGIYPSAV